MMRVFLRKQSKRERSAFLLTPKCFMENVGFAFLPVGCCYCGVVVVMQVSEKEQSVVLTDKGYDDCDRILGKSMFDPRDPWAPFIINSVKAKEIFTRDKVTRRWWAQFNDMPPFSDEPRVATVWHHCGPTARLAATCRQ